MFKRVVLFIATNLAVILVLSVVLRLLGVDRILDESGTGINYEALLILSLVIGFGGSFISLAISKWMAKRTTGARVITNPSNNTEAWLVGTVQRLSQQAGIDMPEVAIYDAPDMNAFATGARRNSALVAVSSGLLQGMQKEEVEAVLAHIRAEPYFYTLSPPVLARTNSIDAFWFDSRRGFCSHYAGAFVFMLRSAGIPARMVGGYQGGEISPVTGHLMVRQYDAHAWAEVWLDGQGWVRFDPTGMVAPERLQRGLSEFLPGARSAADAFVQQTGWLRTLRDTWDAAGSFWQERIVHFNAARQRDLLGWLGLRNIDYRGMAALLLAGALLWGGALLALARLRAAPPPRDGLAQLWDQFLSLLGRRGITVAAHEGPVAICHRAGRALPQANGPIRRFCTGYMSLRFGRDGQHTSLRALRRELRAIARASRIRQR